MTDKIDFTGTIQTLNRRFNHFKVISQTDRTLRGIVTVNSEDKFYPSYPTRNLFTLYITCDTGYPGVHDNIHYQADITMLVNNTEKFIFTIGYASSIVELIQHIESYFINMSAMILDLIGSNVE